VSNPDLTSYLSRYQGNATFGVVSGRIFDLVLDLRSHRIVISPHYEDATDVGTPTGQPGKGGGREEGRP
jgi:hypothetical protein